MSALVTRPPSVTGRRRDDDVTRLLPRPLLVTVVVVLLLVVLGPVAYMVLASLNSDIGVAAGEIWPREWHPSNYVSVWSTVIV